MAQRTLRLSPVFKTYVFAIHKESGKSLSETREEYMAKQAAEFED